MSTVPFSERGGKARGCLDLVSGRYPAFVFGAGLGEFLPVFHFHEVTRDELEPKLRHLADNGYRSVTSDEILAYVLREKALPARSVGLCFDDAWKSLADVAAPLLKQHGLTAITYAIPARITEDGEGDSPFVTWSELSALQASGVVEVQSHTESHSRIFSAGDVEDFVQPGYEATPLLNRPQLSAPPALAFVTPADLGAPIYGMRSRMSDGRRALVSPDIHAACVNLVAREGGPMFFSRPDWRNRLNAIVSAAAPAPFESDNDQARAIEDELANSRAILNDRLKTQSVAHICLPWGISGSRTEAMLKRTGYRSAFANRLRGQHAVHAGDDPFWLKRLPNHYITRLPGRGRQYSVFMTQTFPEDVGVAIVCYNNREKLGATLASLDAAGCPRSRVLVVDGGSTDWTADWLREVYPDVRVHRLETNAGPNPGRNIGIRETPQPYVFLMDADVQVQPATIPRLRDAMAGDRTIGIGSPIVVHAGDPATIQYAGGSLHFICEAINPWMNRPLAERGTANADVGVASGNGLLIDREAALAVGLFDERYFMGKDDGDFTHRMRIGGYRIVEVPDALVLHGSRPRSDWLFYYQLRNRWHFMLKNYQWRTLIFLAPCLGIHEPLQLIVLHLKGHGGTYWKAVRGLFEMLPDLPRDRAAVARFRKLNDGALLKSDRLIVREDLMTPLARAGKNAYEGFLAAYWSLLRHTVLPG